MFFSVLFCMREIQCFNCKKKVQRTPSQIKRSNRHYCSRSCAVQINNSLKPKRQKQEKALVIVKCSICRNTISNATRAKKYCSECARQKNINRTTEYRRQLKIKAVDYLGGKCMKCAYSHCLAALEFHHRDPQEKDFTIGNYSNLSWPRIIKELDKYDLLCANCHRETHA